VDSDEWDARYAAADLLWSSGPNQFVVSEVSDLPPGRALDVACGEGRNALWLAARGWTATGADFSSVALDKAVRIADKRGVSVTWVHADVVTWTPDPQAYDLVLVFYLQLPRERRAPAFLAAAHAVAVGGTLLVVGHDSTNLTDGYGGPSEATVLYAPDDVVADIAAAHLDVVKAERVERHVDTDEGPRVAIDCLVRATRVCAPH
jgi:SAM-dependent methyltransferase